MGLVRLDGTITGTGTTVLYTVPALASANILSIRLTNASANDITLTLYNAVSLGSTDVYTVSLSAGDILTDSFTYCMSAGDTISVTTTAANTSYILTIQEY